MITDLDIPIRRDHIDRSGYQWRLVSDRAHRQLAVARQDLAEMTGMARIEMLRENNRYREPGGQHRHQGRECFDAASRRADHDETGQVWVSAERNGGLSRLGGLGGLGGLGTGTVARLGGHGARV